MAEELAERYRNKSSLDKKANDVTTWKRTCHGEIDLFLSQDMESLEVNLKVSKYLGEAD